MERIKSQKIVETEAYLSDLLGVIHKGQKEIELRDEIKKVIFENPLIGAVMPRTGGMRKVRYATAGKGKRGGYRVIYYFYDGLNPIYLITIYAKSSDENLTSKEEKSFFELAKALKNIFKNRERL